MTVAILSKNKNIKKLIKDDDGILFCFLDNVGNINIEIFDLIIVDVFYCNGKLDIAKLQSNRTIFVLLELTEESLKKAISNFQIGEVPFTYKNNGKKYTIDLNDIVYFESRHKVVRGYNDRGEFIKFYAKLDDVERSVEHAVKFLRVNKSYLVNYDYCSIQKDGVDILNKYIQISRTRKDEFFEKLNIIEKM